MARRVKVFLIRHGETVDNVAQVYAGRRDSALTNHGYQQATRLGLHFNALGLSFTHLFSSHLQRAAKTAGLIREAQTTKQDVVQLPLLMEKDFGFYEGKKWYEKPPEPLVGNKEQPLPGHKKAAGFVDVESKDSMAERADTFLDSHLIPLLESPTESVDHVVAIVSHGMILSVLWKRLLLRLPPKSVALAPEISADARVSLEHLGAWSNTGYLELHLKKIATHEADAARTLPPPVALEKRSSEGNSASVLLEVTPSKSQQTAPNSNIDVSVQPATLATKSIPSKLAHGWTTVVQTINGKDHLKGLKRTGGGVGSARHDTSQKSIDRFFKRRKIE